MRSMVEGKRPKGGLESYRPCRKRRRVNNYVANRSAGNDVAGLARRLTNRPNETRPEPSARIGVASPCSTPRSTSLFRSTSPRRRRRASATSATRGRRSGAGGREKGSSISTRRAGGSADPAVLKRIRRSSSRRPGPTSGSARRRRPYPGDGTRRQRPQAVPLPCRISARPARRRSSSTCSRSPRRCRRSARRRSRHMSLRGLPRAKVLATVVHLPGDDPDPRRQRRICQGEPELRPDDAEAGARRGRRNGDPVSVHWKERQAMVACDARPPRGKDHARLSGAAGAGAAAIFRRRQGAARRLLRRRQRLSEVVAGYESPPRTSAPGPAPC